MIFNNVSKNGLGLLVLVVEAVLSAIGIEFEPGTVAKAVEGAAVVAAFILMAWNQFDRENVKWFFFK